MSHANAALTPKARLRLARLVVDDDWPVARAAERFQVSWPTANRWAERYRQVGADGMKDRSSRPHRSPRRTPQPTVRTIVQCAGNGVWVPSPSPASSACPPQPCARCWSAAGSTGSCVSTGPPANRSAATNFSSLVTCCMSM